MSPGYISFASLRPYRGMTSVSWTVFLSMWSFSIRIFPSIKLYEANYSALAARIHPSGDVSPPLGFRLLSCELR